MYQSFKLALRSIWGNKMRSFLTMLGIIIGVAAVIILVSIVNGYMGSVVENFASMGVNRINVNVTNLSSRSLDEDDMYAFYEENTELFAQISPSVSVNTSVKHSTDEMDSTSVGGYSEQYLDIMDYELEAGEKYCLLGHHFPPEGLRHRSLCGPDPVRERGAGGEPDAEGGRLCIYRHRRGGAPGGGRHGRRGERMTLSGSPTAWR